MRFYITQLREFGPYYLIVHGGMGAGYKGGWTLYARLPFLLARLLFRRMRNRFKPETWHTYGIRTPSKAWNKGVWIHWTRNGNSIWSRV